MTTARDYLAKRHADRDSGNYIGMKCGPPGLEAYYEQADEDLAYLLSADESIRLELAMQLVPGEPKTYAQFKAEATARGVGPVASTVVTIPLAQYEAYKEAAKMLANICNPESQCDWGKAFRARDRLRAAGIDLEDKT